MFLMHKSLLVALHPGKDPVPVLQEAGWTPELVWTGGISRPNRDSIPDRPARSKSLTEVTYFGELCFWGGAGLEIFTW